MIFRIDHVGSLVRPREVLDALEAFEDGRLSADALREIQDRHIRRIVTLQEDIGLPAVTDGEFRRRSYSRVFYEAVEGLEQVPGPFSFKNSFGPTVPVKAAQATSHLRRRSAIAADDFGYLSSIARNLPKATLPTPSHFHFGLFDRVAGGAYTDIDAYFADLVQVYREELADLAARGCRLVQLDEVPLAMLCDPVNQQIVRANGEDPDRLISLYIRLNNEIILSRPAGMTVVVHLCRGNQVGMWAAAGGYEPIAEQMFSEQQADGFLLEFDSERAGGFAPLKYLPAGRVALLGLISTKTSALESADELKRKIDEASRHVPLDRLGLCPQCGFAASARRVAAQANPMTEAVQTSKLRLLLEVGTSIWGDMCGLEREGAQ
jgi:5-methyltetrahydropteroyltriglutamate--homocysteine methyltransferase